MENHSEPRQEGTVSEEVIMPWSVPFCYQIDHGELDVGEGLNLRLLETMSPVKSNAQWLVSDQGSVEHYVSGQGWLTYGGLWCESLGYPRTGPRMPNTDSWFLNHRPPANYATRRKSGPRASPNLEL